MRGASAILNLFPGLPVQDRTEEIIHDVCLSSMGKNAVDMSGMRGGGRRATSENRGQDDRGRKGWAETETPLCCLLLQSQYFLDQWNLWISKFQQLDFPIILSCTLSSQPCRITKQAPVWFETLQLPVLDYDATIATCNEDCPHPGPPNCKRCWNVHPFL